MAVGTAITRSTYRLHRQEWLGEHAAEQQTDRCAAGGDGAEDPECFGRSGAPWKVTVSSPSAEGARIAPKAPCSARAPH